MMNEFDETENGQLSQIARPSTIDLPKMAKITIGTFLCTPQNTIKTTTTTFGVVRYSPATSNSLKRSYQLLSLIDRNNYHCIVVRSFLFNLSIIKFRFHEICGRHLPISHCELSLFEIKPWNSILFRIAICMR